MRLYRHARPPERLAPKDAVLEARAVSVAFGKHVVVDALDLAVQTGELVALVGPNGAGKSTLLAALAGDLAPNSGQVLLDGHPLSAWSPTELAMRRAVLPQQVVVTFPFTVRDIIQMGRSPWLGSDAEDEDDSVLAAIAAETELNDLLDRQFPSLSGGERARVALARVLAQRAQFLLLDEPTAALDLHHQELVLQLVADRVHKGDAAVVVLHDLGLAAAYAHRIVVMSLGRIVAQGSPTEVLDAQMLSEVYGHNIEVIAHPQTGEPMVLPVRKRATTPA